VLVNDWEVAVDIWIVVDKVVALVVVDVAENE
jgi:hypothetical protein